jgi:O-antigen ligase
MSGTLLTLAIGGLATLCLVLWGAAAPLRTILPVYAFLVPLGGVFALRVPLPPPFNTLSSAAGALAIACLLVYLMRSGRGRVPSLPVGAWLLFVGWGAVSLLWAVEQTDVIREISLAIPLLALVLLVSMVPATTSDLRRTAWATLLPGAAIGAYGLFLLVTGGALPQHELAARFSLGAGPADTNPNQLAASLLLPLLLGAGLTLEGASRRQPVWQVRAATGATILTAVAIILSGSRGGALAALIGVATLLTTMWRWQPWHRARIRAVALTAAVGMFGVIGLGVVVTAVAPDSKVAGIVGADAVRRLGEVDSTSGRAEIWTAGVLACQAYCGVGSGLGTFSGVYNDVLAFSNVTRNVGLNRPGHNLYLEIAVETGLVGMLLFWAAVGLEFRTIVRRRTAWLAPVLTATIVAILVADIFEGFLWFKHAWLPFMLVRVFERASDGERETEVARELAIAGPVA